MKFLKLLLFLILIVLIGGVLFFSVKESQYDIADSTEIAAPTSLIYKTVNDYKTWEHWGPWKKVDSTMAFSYPEKTSGIGGSYSWTGTLFPDGNMTTTSVEENKSIQQDLTLMTPGGERNPKVYWNFEPTEAGGTKVTWGMRGEHTLMDKIKYAFNGTNFEADVHTMNQNGFKGLSAFAKAEQEKFSVEVNGVTEYGGGFFLYITSSSKPQIMAQTMGQNFGALSAFAKQEGLKQNGMPFTIYNEMLEGGAVIMSNALPMKEKIIVAGDTNILNGYMPKKKVVKVTLKGNYTNLGAAWGEAFAYMAANNIEQGEAKPFEIYTNDPGDFPNPADLITEIYIPVK